MTFSLFSDGASDRIPASQGLYAFFLDLVSPAKIGLGGRGPWSDEVLLKAKRSLIEKVKLQAKAMNSIALSGVLREVEKGEHLRIAYSLTAVRSEFQHLIDEVRALPIESVREYAFLLHQAAAITQPIYVGITVDQTLKERYVQHRTAHFSFGTTDSAFGVRLRNIGVEWDDVLFGCVSFETAVNPSLVLATLERHLHSLAHPVLSIR